MSANKDPQSYLMAAGGLAFVAAGITYCAVNWDDPPEWWPNYLQPWWNKKESEPIQTDKFVKHVDEREEQNDTTSGGKDETKEKSEDQQKELKQEQEKPKAENVESAAEL